MDAATRNTIHALVSEVDQEWAFDRRKEYLSDIMADLVVKWWEERAYLDRMISESRMLDTIFTRETMDNILYQIVKHVNELYYRRQSMLGRQTGVTQDEVRQAKSYPFEELHPFVRGRSACPIHGGNNPQSFVLLKDNTARCHACGWHGDVIDFWMWKNGRSFADAVRSLQ